MQKDFDNWNKIKKDLDTKHKEVFFKEGEIWWIYMGLNIGFEINGKGNKYMRPTLILKKYNQYSFLGLPLPTSKKINWYKIPVGKIANKDSFVNLSQIKNFDSKRLINKIGFLKTENFGRIKKKAREINFN